MKKLRQFLSLNQLSLIKLFLLTSLCSFSQDHKQYRMISEIILDKSNLRIMSMPEEMIYNRENINLDSIFFTDKKNRKIKKKYIYDKSILIYIERDMKIKNSYIFKLIFQSKIYKSKLVFKENVDLNIIGIKQENKNSSPILYFNSFYDKDRQIFSLNLKEKIMNLGTPIIRDEYLLLNSKTTDSVKK